MARASVSRTKKRAAAPHPHPLADTYMKPGVRSKGATHAGTPHVVVPHAAAPHAAVSHAGIPHAETPHVGSPHAGTPHVGSPHVGTPHAGSPPVGTPHAAAPHPGARKKPLPVPTVHGSFPPPRGTLLVAVGRQPDHFTCGAETFLGIAEYLRLPHRNPDMGLWKYRIELHTSYRTGTAPADLARGARDHLGIEGHVETDMSIDALARLTNRSQHYAHAINRGVAPTKPLTLAMVTYQAYVDPHRKYSEFIYKGKEKRLPIRSRDGAVIWENDWSDGHWSLVVRVVEPHEEAVLRSILKQSKGGLGWRDIAGGLVILADPSNGEGLSFIPKDEFERRWHDTNDINEAVYEHTAVVFTIPVKILQRMQREANLHGVPVFSTVQRNSVVYVP